MKKALMIILVIAVIISTFCACKNQKTDLEQEEVSTPVETEIEETKDMPSFSGGLLEESDDEDTEKQEHIESNDETVQEETDESKEEETSEPKEEDGNEQPANGGIPSYSGDSDMLEPPAEGSAGVL